LTLSWYLHRLKAMSPGEMAHRARDVAVKAYTSIEEAGLRGKGAALARGGFATAFRQEPERPSPAALEALSTAADTVTRGRLSVFEVERADMGESPDWFLDPKTGLRAPEHEGAFRINQRAWPGSLKHVWEPSRHQHLTMLAAAFHFNGDDAAVRFLMGQLQSWWQANPPFRGVNWTSGIEIGMRLISWVWIRRLLDHHDEAPSWFEQNPRFLDQLYAHQLWLDRLPSYGTSANNHAIAEWAGQFVAACAFPLFPETSRWRDRAARGLVTEAKRQIDGDGMHRELATDYHGFVAELLILAGLEGEAAATGLGTEYWVPVRSMVDVMAAFLDGAGRPPRQGDSDDAIALVVDGPGFDRWASLLATGSALFERLPWWPSPAALGDVRSSLLAAFGSLGTLPGDRPRSRPVSFRESGMTILRSGPGERPEVWCRCDAGPLGYSTTAAHGHDDALSVELRHDGVDLLADPGTYCYQSEPSWRSYFRSIRAHNTLELAKARHPLQRGPFIWSTTERSAALEEPGDSTETWLGRCIRAHVDGGEIVHERSVIVEGTGLTIEDRVDRPTTAISRFHLGPLVDCLLEGSVARLTWQIGGLSRSATVHLPETMAWTAVRGDGEKPLGWFSPAFGVRLPTFTLEGRGEIIGGETLSTRLVSGRIPTSTPLADQP
jgi:hypothetical protein